MGLILPDRTYPAKLLLFGEYVILDGASALSLPFPHFTGKIEPSSLPKPFWANEWGKYLEQHCATFLDLDIVRELLDSHRYVSSIPVGAGLGSSGALTAALYDAAVALKLQDLSFVKEQLALMESYFHGSSSGLDPLVSFLDKAICCHDDGTIEEVTIDSPDGIHIYLLDSGRSRVGKDMIADFLKTIRGSVDLERLRAQSDGLIQHVVGGSLAMYKVQGFSFLQYEVMQPMIITALRDIWKEGLESGEYAMKLCGAGGGGYYLVFSEKERDHLQNFPLLEVYLSGDNQDN